MSPKHTQHPIRLAPVQAVRLTTSNSETICTWVKEYFSGCENIAVTFNHSTQTLHITTRHGSPWEAEIGDYVVIDGDRLWAYPEDKYRALYGLRWLSWLLYLLTAVTSGTKNFIRSFLEDQTTKAITRS